MKRDAAPRRLFDRVRVGGAGRFPVLDDGGAGVGEVGGAADFVIEAAVGDDGNIAGAAGARVGDVAGKTLERGVASAAGFDFDEVGLPGESGGAGAIG